MKKWILIFSICYFNILVVNAQTYTLWSRGNPTDTVTATTPCTLLMGGATEDDQAMKKFLQYANHGDIVVIRTSGSDGYNNYLYSDLGIQVHSVQTLLITTVAAANDSFVVQTVRNAEALWIAGGDQWTYVNNWKGTALNSAINHLINVRHVPIGGTSAGMAIMGEYYNSAQGGSAVSSTVLANPYHSTVTIGNSDFINNNLMLNTITDSHFDNPDRRGRLMTFIARTWKDKGVKINGIACDEYTSVLIDTNYKATVYGGGPSYDDNAYFVRVDCEGNNSIENCVSGSPLNWKQDSSVVKVYKIQSDSSGTQYFDLRNFGASPTYLNNGGVWLNWWISNGSFNSANGNPILCTPNLLNETNENDFDVIVSPNPMNDQVYLDINLEYDQKVNISISDISGHVVYDRQEPIYLVAGKHHLSIQLNHATQGVYFMTIQNNSGKKLVKKLIRS